MILRHATEGDAEALDSFDVGDTSAPWIAEVAEIVAGLLAGDPIPMPPTKIDKSS